MRTDLILASGSPRRRELLSDAGYSFRVIVPSDSVEAAVDRNLSPSAFVSEAAYRKAAAIAAELSSGIVLAADTVAVCGGSILGKPRDREDARSMLQSMSGKHHFVLTGVTLWDVTSGSNVTHIESTLLLMHEIGDAALTDHLDSGDWVGKAGAFGFQDGLDWVRIVSGSVSNVVGLPVELLDGWLTRLEIGRSGPPA